MKREKLPKYAAVARFYNVAVMEWDDKSFLIDSFADTMLFDAYMPTQHADDVLVYNRLPKNATVWYDVCEPVARYVRVNGAWVRQP